MRNRLVNYDLLRIFAAYLIIMLHLSVQYIHPTPASYQAYTQWEYAIGFSTFSRIGVPIFIMLSGLFLLNPQKNITISMIFTKYLPKILLIFVFWSFFYAFAEQDFFQRFYTSDFDFSKCWEAMDQKHFWGSVVRGNYHMWYLYMLVGLYLITPLVRVIAAHATKHQFVYFIVLCMLITFITKFNDTLWKAKLLSEALDTLALTFVFGYIGYFLAGYFLDKLFIYSEDCNKAESANQPNDSNELTSKRFDFRLVKRVFNALDKRAMVIYSLGIIAFIFTVVWTITANPMFGFKIPELILFSNYSPTVFLMSFAVFTFTAKCRNTKFPRFFRVIAKRLPKYMLLVYMVHPFIISEVGKGGLLSANNFAFSLPLNAFLVFLISLAVSIVLMHAYNLLCRIGKLRFR